MVPIKEALTFDDVTLAPNYSEILPSETDTSMSLTKNLKLKIPLLSSAMDTVTESKMAIAIAKVGGIGVIHRNFDIKTQVSEIRKVKKYSLKVGAAVGASEKEFVRAKEMIKKNGYFISKIFMGGTFNEIVAEGKKFFKEVKIFKPKSSRKYSKESFIICRKIR